jgi:hypothetical protein
MLLREPSHPFPRFLKKSSVRIYEIPRTDRSRWVEQKLSETQNSQMRPSGSFRGHKGQKSRLEFFELKMFFVVTRTQSRCVRFFSLKNTKYMRQEKQNTEDTVKTLFFPDAMRFLEADKFYRNHISKKRKHALQFD